MAEAVDSPGDGATTRAPGMVATPAAITDFVRGYEEAGCDELVLYDRQGEGWHGFSLTWPRNDEDRKSVV